MTKRLLMALSAVLLLTQPGWSQDSPGDVEAGRRIAGIWCNNCHLTDAGPQSRATDAAPSFRSIARMPSSTYFSLRAFLQTPHSTMPNYRLTPDELNDVIAYILSLDDRQPPIQRLKTR